MFKKRFATLTIETALLSVAAFAQEDYTRFRSDVTVQALGSFVKGTTKDGTRQDTTNSGGVLGSYRFWFNRHSGVEADYAWTPNTEKYDLSGVKTNLHESRRHTFFACR